jgi:hypothetical protein
MGHRSSEPFKEIVMNPLRSCLVGLVFLLPLAVPVTAAEEPDQPRKNPPEEVRRPVDGLVPFGILEKLDLSQEQKERVAKLHREAQERMETARKRLAEVTEQARQNQDREKAEQAAQAFRKEIGKVHEEFHDQLRQVLSDAQKQRLAELQRDQPGRPGLGLLPRVLGQLDLTAEQREKVGTLMREMQEKQEAAQKKFQESVEQARQNQDRAKIRELAQAHEMEVARLHAELRDKVRQLLTEEQKKRLAELEQRPEPGFRPPFPGGVLVLPPPLQERLGLTPEQREKVGNLQKEMEAKLKAILTEEQNRKLEEFRRGGPPPERKDRQEP